MSSENCSTLPDVNDETMSGRVFNHLCVNSSLKYKVQQGNRVTTFNIKINPEDPENPLILIGNSATLGKIYLNRVHFQLDQNPDGARFSDGYSLIIKFDSFETGPIDFSLAIFSTKKILGRIINTYLTPFIPHIRNNDVGQQKIVKQKTTLANQVSELLLIKGLVQRAARFKLR